MLGPKVQKAICNVVLCPSGEESMEKSGYLGSYQSEWQAYDAAHLVQSCQSFSAGHTK